MTITRLLAIFVVGAFLAVSDLAQAVPFEITAELTGDPRPGNPDGLNIDVTITGDTTSDVVTWTVNLDMATEHPGAFLGEFYFNVAPPADDYAFGGFDPADWEVVAPASSVGGGSIIFLFEAHDTQPGASHGPRVTNTQNLSFTMTKLTGDFDPADFLGAGGSCSSDAVLGCGPHPGGYQLGAHVQGLTTTSSGQSDSGFAVGIYEEPVDVLQTSVSSPATLLLVGAGLVFLWGWRSRRS